MATVNLAKDHAERVIVRYLRDKMQSGDANKLAAEIATGLVSSTPDDTSRVGLGRNNWHAIPPLYKAPDGTIEALVGEARRWNPSIDSEVVEELWRMIWERGIDIGGDT